MMPLKGIKVLEFGNAIFAPLCASLLGLYGADVIKVEPPEGDLARLTAGGGDSILFLSRNPGKKSLALDWRNEESKDILVKLISQADVMVHNHRPLGMKSKGLDYESVSRLNPRIVYASLSMYGENGPLANLPGADPWAQAFTGFVASQGNPGEGPYLVGHSVCDNTGAVLAAYGIMMALFQRERTGMGQELTTSLVNAGVYLQQDAIAHYLIDGMNLVKGGRGHYRGLFPYGPYPAKDGDVVTIFGQDDEEWKTVCKLLGVEELLNNSKYDSVAKRSKYRTELYPILDKAFRKKSRQEWQEAFRAVHLRCDPCLDYAELLNHPQFLANDPIIKVQHPRDGELKLLAAPVNLKGQEEKNYLPAPVLGQHTVEILKDIGYTDKQVTSFLENGVVFVPTEDMMKPGAKRSDTGQMSSVTKTRKYKPK